MHGGAAGETAGGQGSTALSLPGTANESAAGRVHEDEPNMEAPKVGPMGKAPLALSLPCTANESGDGGVHGGAVGETADGQGPAALSKPGTANESDAGRVHGDEPFGEAPTSLKVPSLCVTRTPWTSSSTCILESLRCG